MGNCTSVSPASSRGGGPQAVISLAPDGLCKGGDPKAPKPKCARCGVTGYFGIGKMQTLPRSLSLQSNGLMYCRQCCKARKKERRQFLQERTLYAMVKEELFPRVRTKPALRTIESGKRWDDSESFKGSLASKDSFKSCSSTSSD